jgi:hypothetical protein
MRIRLNLLSNAKNGSAILHFQYCLRVGLATSLSVYTAIFSAEEKVYKRLGRT